MSSALGTEGALLEEETYDREAWEEGGPRESETLEGGWGTEV